MSKGKTRSASSPGMVRDFATGKYLGVIDERDARDFQKANAAFKKSATASKASAIKALKASGYLTKSGVVAKRYR